MSELFLVIMCVGVSGYACWHRVESPFWLCVKVCYCLLHSSYILYIYMNLLYAVSASPAARCGLT